MRSHLFLFLWIVGALALFLYSFTQVDLSLTLNQTSLVQTIQKSFQSIGYFNRPLSTYIYIGIISGLFILYIWTLRLVKQKKLTAKKIWITIIAVSAILLFSYNAFSYDIFNYIFDARILSEYHENPYEHKALDYPADPMLSFMRWTHRIYPYGPTWLVLTVPLTFFGTSFFLGTFYLFKLLMVGSFLGSVFLIEKIARKTKIIDPLFAVAFFALNPLVIIESLVSSHNDIVMIFVSLISIYLLFQKKYIASIIAFFFAGLIKYATFFLLPMYIYYVKTKKTKEFFLGSIVLMTVALLAATYRTQFQPWYLLLILPFVSFLSNKYYFLIPSIILSIAALLQYVLFLYNGNWDAPIPLINAFVMGGGIIISIIVTAGFFLHKNKK